MKKHSKYKSYSEPAQAEPDIAGLIIKLQQQLFLLDKKIDTLLSSYSHRPAEVKSFSRPFQQSGHSQNQGGRRPESYGERTLHKAICADCKKECEVPFKPSGERPVYCKECFGKRKTGSSFRDRPDNRPREAAPVQETHTDRPHGNEKKRFAGKKKLSKNRKRSK